MRTRSMPPEPVPKKRSERFPEAGAVVVVVGAVRRRGRDRGGGARRRGGGRAPTAGGDRGAHVRADLAGIQRPGVDADVVDGAREPVRRSPRARPCTDRERGLDGGERGAGGASEGTVDVAAQGAAVGRDGDMDPLSSRQAAPELAVRLAVVEPQRAVQDVEVATRADGGDGAIAARRAGPHPRLDREARTKGDVGRRDCPAGASVKAEAVVRVPGRSRCTRNQCSIVPVAAVVGRRATAGAVEGVGGAGRRTGRTHRESRDHRQSAGCDQCCRQSPGPVHLRLHGRVHGQYHEGCADQTRVRGSTTQRHHPTSRASKRGPSRSGVQTSWSSPMTAAPAPSHSTMLIQANWAAVAWLAKLFRMVPTASRRRPSASVASISRRRGTPSRRSVTRRRASTSGACTPSRTR